VISRGAAIFQGGGSGAAGSSPRDRLAAAITPLDDAATTTR
jgi:hypothetical protein